MALGSKPGAIFIFHIIPGVKIALAQIDTTVGDIRGNLEKIVYWTRFSQKKGADLVAFPELAITGYPPWDLLEQRSFIQANLAALKVLTRNVGDTAVVVGFVDLNPKRTGKSLQNSVALLHRGKLVAKRAKCLLPTYDVFDEGRYFAPARENPVIPFKGLKLGLTICEDAWNDKDFWPKQLYPFDPVARQARAGADLLINISSSPFHRGKTRLRLKMLQSHARKAKAPFFYCNLTGGNDELIFDGNSLVLDGQGHLLARGRAFEEDLMLVDLEKPPSAVWFEGSDIEQVYQALLVGIRDYTRKCGFRKIFLGLSGGIDSAVVCALAAQALGKDNVTGVAMPSPFSSDHSVTDAEALAKNLGIRYLKIPISRIFQSYLDTLKPAFENRPEDTTEQNIQARIRGGLLMALANKYNGLALTTGNKSELSVGYCTLYGDMAGGLAPLADVPKTTVYALAHFINRAGMVIPKNSIEKPPSAELKPGQTDQDDLPPYDVLDRIRELYIEQDKSASDIARKGIPRRTVLDIIDRIDKNEYKRRQAPPGLKITPKSFGVGRKMPLARGYHRIRPKVLEPA